MGYFKKDRDIVRVKLPSDENYWVDIYASLAWGEQKKFLNVDSDGNVDMETSANKLLEAAIVDWNLDDDAGNKMPINSDSLDLMLGSDVLFITKELGAEQVEKEKQRKN